MAGPDYQSRVLPLLKKVREAILSQYGAVAPLRQKSASPADVVTECDLLVEDTVSKGLRKAFPDISFVGEESGGDRSTSRHWLMDPIDGTAHFVRGMPFCSIMLALIENGAVTFGAIVLIENGDAYVAGAGQGATKNGMPISVSTRSLADGYVAYESKLDHGNNLQLMVELRKRTTLMKTLSAGFEFAMIAEGKMEGRVNFTPWGMDYDFAPGSLLVQEAGGQVVNLGATTYDFRNTDLIAGNKKIISGLAEGNDALFPVQE